MTGIFTGNALLGLFGPSLIAEFTWRFPIIILAAIGILFAFAMLVGAGNLRPLSANRR